MKKSYRFTLPNSGQVVFLEVEINEDDVAEFMMRRAVMNDSWKSIAMHGAIQATIVGADK